MDQKIKIRKQIKLSGNDDFENFTKEELIEKVKALSAHNIQLKNILTKQANSNKTFPKRKQAKSFEFSKYTFQHVALQFLYLGWDYKGYVLQEDTIDTIEHYLFEALLKTKLIQDRTTSNYHRCGRTDKGVSSFGQVISIDLRSNGGKKEEINYCKVLNSVLPDDIHCVAWSPVDTEFSARFDCQSRTYKYYFPKGDLNIEQMKEAAKKLFGNHDFRNFCKMDVGNGVVEFNRNILETGIEPFNKNEHVSEYDIYVLTIKGKAFLWHQIRCIMGILFLIGQGKEKPELIDQLLDVEKYPRKPEYGMASEVPLNLHYCEFENISWHYDNEVLSQVIEKLNRACTFHAIKSTMINEMVKTLEVARDTLKGNFKKICLSENLQTLKCKNYTQILNRKTCYSLEDKIENYKKRKRIQVVTEEKK